MRRGVGPSPGGAPATIAATPRSARLRDDGRGTRGRDPSEQAATCPHYIHHPLTRGGPKSGGRPVGIALDVGVERHPLFFLNEIRDQALQLGGVLNLVLGLAEDHPQRSGLLAQLG